MYAIFFLGIVRDQRRLAVMMWPVGTWYKGSRDGCQALANKQIRQHGWVTLQQELAMGGREGREGGEDRLRGKGWSKEATLKAMRETRTQPRRPH